MPDALPSKLLTSPVPANETERLAALYRYKILDTPSEAAFDRITQLAARLFNVPIALISLVDESRAWFKSCIGFSASEVPRDATLCSFAVLTDKPLIVPDTRLDDRFACNPFVQSEPGVRFYAGAPLLTQDGFNLGTLCLLDSQPREPLTPEQQATLIDLAAMVVDELELRLSAQEIAQVNAALRESEERLSAIFYRAAAGLSEISLTGQFQRVNDELCHILGRSREEMLTSSVAEVTYPEDVAKSLAAFETLIETGEPVSLDKRYFRSDGAIVWANSNLTRLDDEQGRPCSVLVVTVDLSDRKSAELEIQKFVSLADNSTEFIGMCDLNFLPFYVNAAGMQMVGLDDVQQYKQTPVQEFFFPEDQNFIVNEFFPRVLREGQAEVEIRFRHFKTGEALWMIYNVFFIRGENNQPIGLATVSRNITDRIQAELEREAFLVRERHYANQLRGLTHAALAINSAHSVQEVLQVITNQAASIIGVHQSVTSLTINQNWAQAINAVYLSQKYAQWRDYDEPTDGSGIYACVCNTNRSIRMTQAELEAHPRWKGFGNAADRHPPMQGWLAAPLIGRDGRNIGLIQLSDKEQGEFTETDESILVQLAQMASVAVENARLYEAEQQAREEAQAANRVKDEFLAVLSHELRTPLNPILGWARLLQSPKVGHDKLQQGLATIQRNAQQQAQLIEDLLDISKIIQGKLTLKFTDVHLTEPLTAAVETVQLAAQAKGIHLEVLLDPVVAPVNGDAGRLQQVMWNLLSNAIKFTPHGGRVTIRLSQEDDRDAQIQVIDTGKGIQPKFLPHVFELFRQQDSSTTRSFGGLGLGLAISRQIIEAHGGTITAASQGEGTGATFTIRLPLMSTHTLPMIDRTTPMLSGLQNLRLLTVDDELDSLELVKMLLEAEGAIVTAVTSAAAALEALQQTPFDLLISDIGMPKQDGYWLIQQVRALPQSVREIPAIALTAYAGEANQRQVLQAGFEAHLSKPLSPDLLMERIKTLLN